MKSINLLSLLTPFENFLITKILTGKNWKIKTLLFTLIFSFTIILFFNNGYIFQNFKNFYLDTILQKHQPYFFWNSIVEQGHRPFTPNNHSYGSHESNRTFRLTIPLIARFLSLNSFGLFILQAVLGIVFIYLLIIIFEKILKDKLLIFYALLSFVNVYAGSNFFLNCFGHGDGYTFFFILISLLIRNPLLLSVGLQLSFWSDERSIITVLGVFLFQYFYYQLSSKASIRLLITIFLNVLVYIGLRLYLSSTFHLQAADVESSSIQRFVGIALSISSWWGARVYLGIEGFLLPIIITFVILYIEKKYLYLSISLAYWLPILLITLLVADTVRTISFTFVFWLVSFFFLKTKVNNEQLKILFFLTAFINILIPIIFP